MVRGVDVFCFWCLEVAVCTDLVLREICRLWLLVGLLYLRTKEAQLEIVNRLLLWESELQG